MKFKPPIEDVKRSPIGFMEFDEILLSGLSLFGIFAFFTTFFLNASYGRFSSTGIGQGIPKINGK